MKIWIIGGSGFIGTNLVESLLAQDYTILNIDVVPPRCLKHQPYWQYTDINDLNNFQQNVANYNPQYIVHLAARTDLDGKNLDDYSVNIRGVENLMHIIPKLTDLQKVLITSSMLVCRTGYIPTNPFDFAPSTFYGASKVETEKIVWSHQPTCDWAILRPTSIWGPWFGTPYKDFFDMVLSGRYFHIGHRGCTKTYGYVGNAVYQIERLLFQDTWDNSNKIFYIGDNPATNIEQWADEIAKEIGSQIRHLPLGIIRIAGWIGDLLQHIGIHFPMTSFRLTNMTTDNKVNLENTYRVAPNPPYDRIEGIRTTLQWIQEQQ